MRTIGSSFTYRCVNWKTHKTSATYVIPILYTCDLLHIDSFTIHTQWDASSSVQCDVDRFWKTLTRTAEGDSNLLKSSMAPRMILFNKYNDVWDMYDRH